MSNAARTPIPAQLKRQVKLEAGHRCAIPTCRSWPIELAHIVPYRIVKNHTFDNLIALCPTCHSRYDNSKDIDVTAMREYKARLGLAHGSDSRYSLGVISVRQKGSRPPGLSRLYTGWFNELTQQQQLNFYRVSIIVGTMLAVLLQLRAEQMLKMSFFTVITPLLTVMAASVLLFFIQREYGND